MLKTKNLLQNLINYANYILSKDSNRIWDWFWFWSLLECLDHRKTNMTSCEHSRWPLSRINVKNNTILRKPFTNGLRSFWTSKGVFQHQEFFSARKWCLFLSTRISRHPRFAQSQMRRCAFHYNVVPKNAWIFLRTWNVLRWKKNVSCYICTTRSTDTKSNLHFATV